MGNGPTLVAELEGLVGECAARLDQALTLEDLEAIRVAFLGRKGRLAGLMAQLPALDADARRDAGRVANTVKQSLTGLYDARLAALNRDALAAALADFDPTAPGLAPFPGSLHPVTLVTAEICKALGELGFSIVTGPEIETDYYNFEALNMPPEHPARDKQDTLYITDSVVLRTHTSPLQIRTMLAQKPPVAVIAPGKVYRRDSDLTHTPMFHQIEGLLVDEGVSMADLRGTLTAFVRRIFGPATNVRFRPSFFPFTEPSAEVDISCVLCGGKGSTEAGTCRVCKGTGFVEILGCGMVDPNVFEAVGYDTERYTGFAFGMGVERVTMLKYGIGDLRMFFENDVRFLSQF
ncbi:phenylalanine--tRNA ligase subunit alpha [Solidesulfovibrio sp.]|uniref:phenylalanine--tRNA ligase subunit alpha n=1 Tax=Solidesulfovibrio sp. TaxID=2910990 RepID=UPI002B220FEB|nr:phenylalanine--tRNA ligase subunit alpha [Solidesulfovibrio sp.]MEA4858475.1 phenylalanine--tRNA ligase subunit alpha [Solidesulfovibrio sp.]